MRSHCNLASAFGITVFTLTLSGAPVLAQNTNQGTVQFSQNQQPQFGQSPQQPTLQPQTGQSPQQPTLRPQIGQSPQQPTLQPPIGQAPQQPTLQPPIAQTPQQPTLQPPIAQTPQQPGQQQPTIPRNNNAIYETSYNCGGNLNATERTICRTEALAHLDVKMANMYGQARSRGGKALRNRQRRWHKTRNACRANVPCLKEQYGQRIAELSSILGIKDDTAGNVYDNLVTYTCGDGKIMQIRYRSDGSQDTATVITQGIERERLVSAVSGSGVRYVGKQVEWHTKAKSGVLSHTGGRSINCSEQ